jgi:hypothetical protein
MPRQAGHARVLPLLGNERLARRHLQAALKASGVAWLASIRASRIQRMEAGDCRCQTRMEQTVPDA